MTQRCSKRRAQVMQKSKIRLRASCHGDVKRVSNLGPRKVKTGKLARATTRVITITYEHGRGGIQELVRTRTARASCASMRQLGSVSLEPFPQSHPAVVTESQNWRESRALPKVYAKHSPYRRRQSATKSAEAALRSGRLLRGDCGRRPLRPGTFQDFRTGCGAARS